MQYRGNMKVYGFNCFASGGGNVSEDSLRGFLEFMAKNSDSQGSFRVDPFVKYFDDDFGSSSDHRTSGNPNGTSKSGDESSEMAVGGGRHGAEILELLLSSNFQMGFIYSINSVKSSEASSQESFSDGTFVKDSYDDFGSSSDHQTIRNPNGTSTSGDMVDGEGRRGHGAGIHVVDGEGRHGAGILELLLSSPNFPMVTSSQNAPKLKIERPKIQESFACSICHKKFSRKVRSNLCERRHLPWEELKNLPGFHEKCPTCAKIFVDKTDYNRHMDAHNGRRPYKCSICFKAFTQKPTLKKHEKIHNKKSTLKECLKKSCFFCNPEADLIPHLIIRLFKINTLKKSSCYFCAKEFPSRAKLHIHLATHTKESPFLCDKRGCRKRFTQNGDLNRHKKLHLANGGRDFPCSICANSFIQMADLKRHVATVHEGLRIHSCPKCPRAYGQLGVLNRHLKTCH